MIYTLQKNGVRLSQFESNNIAQNKPLRFRKNDYMFFGKREEAEETLRHIEREKGIKTGLVVVKE
jgi:hypothetical protein